MKEFDKLYLSWRKGQGSRRHIVGVLEHAIDGRFVFNYDKTSVEKAEKDGFAPYTEFPDVSKSYNGNALEIFGQRLIKSERPDIQSFYDFWEIEPQHKDDKFYMLGHTQGLQPTDNFEFLADYNLVDGLHFLTELAGLSAYQLPSGTLKEGDVLRFELDKKNEHDSEAVTVFKGDTEIGHIKRIHCKVFHKPSAEKLKLSVKSVDKNGIIKKAFIKVSL
jgi:HIRAN domain